jgi:hypothetical protein
LYSSRLAPRPAASWCTPASWAAAANGGELVTAELELDQEHAGELSRGGGRRRTAVSW